MSFAIYGYKAAYMDYGVSGNSIDECLDKLYQRYLRDSKITEKLDKETFIYRIQSRGLKVYPNFCKPEGKSVLRVK